MSGISSRATTGKVTKMVASTLGEPRAEPTLQSEEEHEHEPRDHGRHREREVDQGHEQALARELELRHGPRSGEAEDDVRGDGDRGHREGEADRAACRRVRERREEGADALAQSLGEHGDERDDQERADEDQRRRDRQVPNPARFGERRRPRSGGAQLVARGKAHADPRWML